ncbi:MAG: sulfatase [Verrucomicrobia bacterium]|nr:sulfatase [Verrucomicrobiota bacterium]
MKTALLFLVFILPLAFSLQPLSAADRPNVLFIAVDDLNVWVTHLGRNQQAMTPNIDRLASRGITFEHAYCAVPACEPSRAALMSGQRPWTTGCYRNSDEWLQIIPEGQGLSMRFKEAGYHTVGAGKIYHSDERFESEWTEYMDGSPYSNSGNVPKDQGYHEPLLMDIEDEDISDWHIVDWCIEQMNTKRDEPMFIACGLHKPHLPFAVPRKYYNAFPLEDIKLPPFLEEDLDDLPPAGVRMAGAQNDYKRFQENGRWKAAIQSYLATCAYTDMNIGRLLDALDKSPIRDNTIIVLWGDHGWSLGEKKHFRKFALWEEPTRMPYIWVVPGMTKAGTQSTRPVDLMSIFPTLCELTDISIPKYVEGVSIVPLLKDPQANWGIPAITTYVYQNHAVRSERWRYIRYADGGEELYDHSKDPYEWTNLALDPTYTSVKLGLRAWLPTEEAPPWPYRK